MQRLCNVLCISAKTAWGYTVNTLLVEPQNTIKESKHFNNNDDCPVVDQLKL